MEDFIVLTKQVEIRSGHKGFSSDHIQLDYLIQETYKQEPQKMLRFEKYELDKSTIKLEVISGALFVVAIAFKKNK